ncbi:MAG TPA: class I SAM-dependent methyltransferase [Steroidobacteraceae bacterium]
MDKYGPEAIYPDTYFREISPVWLNYVGALGGIQSRDLHRPFTYLELGCGQGTSTVTHAIELSNGEFHACDFDSRHIDAARQRAKQARVTNITFHCESFAEFAKRDLPLFDFIVMHGVYSWVDAGVRATLRDLVRQRIRPGGLVYVSYNCLPGWAVEMPLRTLLVEFVRSGMSAREAVQQLKAVSDSKLRYFDTYPEIAAAIDAYQRGPEGYLEHEFLEVAWEPRYSVAVHDEMAGTGLEFVGSATLADNHPPLVMDERAARAVAELKTERQRVLAGDLAVNRRFRRDVFVSGSRTASPAALSDVWIGLPAGTSAVASEVRVPRGMIRFQRDFIDSLGDCLRGGPRTLTETVEAVSRTEAQRTEVGRNVLYLIAAGALSLEPSSRC